ncbi:TIGR02281 family clan AA aspartic protease [Fretibacter rubidus]|uniref:retropepsin-like aspartic protease family protein n=1 Tax=Fretibacter rubidus TaxID=570162 RepID=UPI00352AEDF9
MFDDVLKTVLAVGVMCLVSFWAVTNRHMLYEAAGLMPAQNTEQQTQNVALKTAQKPQKTTSSGGRVSIPKSARDGQFWTEARVNNRIVNFLVDTGAGSIALTPDDAKSAGINPRQLDYDVIIRTANGEGRAARVSLKSVRVGTIRVKNVEALVVEDGLSVSLLGMTFLGEIKKIEVTPDAMVLRN